MDREDLLFVLEHDINSEWISKHGGKRFIIVPQKPKNYIFALIDDDIKKHGTVEKLEDLPNEVFKLMQEIEDED